ncbi:hypothetical protein [Psychroflexus maritimus]|uniref:Uncharacterized protein n=1 Tax=Psychroflexus maritimus TaxID=2714865 RepID=A0A967AJE5_9FLAO|nr:hypothetical protein [Psychroflexus maritimus]NGZ90405.1 hypothetical protein [Psychroflexus maritimus]
MEEFLEYTKQMMKITAKPQVSIEGVKPINYIHPYENNIDEIKAIRKKVWC